MNTVSRFAVLVLAASPVFAGDTQLASELPLRTKTEITVVASQIPVAQSAEKKKVNKVRKGTDGTLRGFGLVAGWLMNANDDIPSPRSRRVLDRDVPDIESLPNRSRVR